MNLLKRIFRVGKHQVENVLDKIENDIKVLEDDLKKYLKSQASIEESLTKLKGCQKKYEIDLNEINNVIAKLDKVAKKCILEGNEGTAKEAFNLRKLRETEKEILIKNMDTNKMAIENIEQQLTNVTNEIKKFDFKIKELKTKKEFSNNINQINKIVNEVNNSTVNLSENKSIIDKIDTNYYIAEVQIENMNNETNIENLMADYDCDFEAYKQQLIDEKNNI